MKEYGTVEPAGTQGYGAARIGLRAPRVAIRVKTGTDWHSPFGLAISAASGFWGGYGFIYLPDSTKGLHPAFARLLNIYDPDYLADALWTHGDMEAMNPGWLARRFKSWPDDPEEAATRFTPYLSEQLVNDPSDGDVGANLCSPFYDHDDFRALRVLSEENDGHGVHRLSTVLGGEPHSDFDIPDGLDSLLTLALGMRAGFPTKPSLPLGRKIENVTERFPREYVEYVLSIRQDRTDTKFAGLKSAWNLTRTGLVEIGKVRPLARPVAVIGSTAEDFALAVALDRMYGAVIWLPIEWLQNEALRWPMAMGLYNLVNTARPSGHPPVVTSISLSLDELETVVKNHWRPLGLAIQDANGQLQAVDKPPQIVPAQHLDLGLPKHLACAGDFDLPFSSPTRADGHGGFEFILPIPVYTPRSDELKAAQHPFWEVDVEVYPPRMPVGRNLRASSMLADENSYSVVRSGQDGISFSPMNMLFVPAGASLEQSVARPRLKILGLHGWIEALAEQERPKVGVQLSQAGRRAMIVTRLWGSRSAVARDLLALNDFMREFKASGSRDADAYPESDGVRLAPGEGYLTFAAAVRTLPGMMPNEIRERLNNLLRNNVLQRGLIVPCSECERRTFYRIDVVGETNACPRCGAPGYATASWRAGNQGNDEPGWFYDLHGAVRELLAQNGDVPLLAGQELARTARIFEDIAELDFHRTDAEQPDEIDIAAMADGRVIVGEAKCVATLGTRRESNQAIQKLIRVSDLIGADEILLATTAPGPWNQEDTGRLRAAVLRHKWRFGSTPTISVMTGLRNDPQREPVVERPAD